MQMFQSHSRPEEIYREEGFVLYLGTAAHAGNSDVLIDYQIGYILNLSERVRFKRMQGVDTEFLHMPMSDYGDSSLLEVFEDTFPFIDSARANKRNILIHCSKGVNRSPTLVIAYLMSHMNLSLNAAYELVKSRRSIISPHEKYMEQLAVYEMQLFGKITLDVEEYSKTSVQAVLRRLSRPNRLQNQMSSRAGGGFDMQENGNDLVAQS
eukprot:TRINITY_DN2589_c0_g1_i1.p1 TRINITY_DN2589_c0_g1~~TRINITY_DN2589_c0_g1_i1.p1  ORF type:complete len:209 (+),score=28.63 TRINITY_DN2589_c0_g1_i1:119-745(+)